MRRSALKTIRFSPREAREMGAYLQKNPTFDSVSSLGRAAILAFIRGRENLPLKPRPAPEPREEESSSRPAFLWDYDLSEAQVRKVLQHASASEREWLMARILERLRLAEVLKFLTLDEIREELPHLKLDPKVKRHWEEALRLWKGPASSS